MSVESMEERTLEVLQLPADVNEELLYLYFENKRRSGGGPLLSVEKKGDHAILVFEDPEAAAGVLTKGHHVLHNMELRVKKAASKDRCRLLLRGINPNTSMDMIELFVENMMGLNVTDYTLYPSPGRDVMLIHLNQPLSKDFQTISAKISKRKLDGAEVTLDLIEQTDSVLVENLHPGTTPDLLWLYFESNRGGDQRVKDVSMLSEGTAKVSFLKHESLGPVLDRHHNLDGADLMVTPYFDFLHAAKITSQNSESRQEDITENGDLKDPGDIQMQTSTPVEYNSQSSFEISHPIGEVVEDATEEAMQDWTEDAETLSSLIAVGDPVKLALLQVSSLPQNIGKVHPDLTIEIKHDGLLIAGTDKQKLDQTKHTIVAFLDNMIETDFTLELEKAQLLARQDVKERLLQTMNQSGSAFVYDVSDSKVVVMSLSQNSAHEACRFLQSQIGHCSVRLTTEYEYMLYCKEWSEFLEALGFSIVQVSERGGGIDVWTLKGMETEKQTAIQQFLSTPIEKVAVISMEPGVLKYIQNTCHQLLADMEQVSIFPLEAEGTCGLKIHGHAVACQMAEEVLQGVVSSVCTSTITVDVPGVARFLGEAACKSILAEMESKFQVYISPEGIPWEYLSHQDIFETALNMMSQKNFQRVLLDGSVQVLKPDSMQTDLHRVSEYDLLNEAKRIVSSIDEMPEVSMSDQLDNMDDMDLYTAEDAHSLLDQGFGSSVEANTQCVLDLTSSLEEEALLSLAIQCSMESNQMSLEEEEQLNKVLKLSREMIQHETSSISIEGSPRVDQPKKNIWDSLQDTIKEANTIQLVVFAGYNSDLIRVDIAFRKKVAQRQIEEKVQHRNIKDLSEYHRTCLEMIKRKHAVKIEIQGNLIAISGFKDYVAGALCDVKILLEKIANSASDMDILQTVQWELHDPASSSMIPYSPDATVYIESAWRMRLKNVDILLDNQPHKINFAKMQECNIASGKQVKVSRKLLDIPEEEYALLSTLPEAIKVSETSDEFQSVVRSFNETIKDYCGMIKIIQVEKLMNRLLYNQYKLKKASIQQSATHPLVERTLYHGTSEDSVKEICVHGFNRSFCGKNATMYGQGVYFAVNSAMSLGDKYSPPNAKGYKFVFVAKVLTGDFTNGGSSMKTAPLKQTSDIPLRYDSVTDDISRPSMFVIFNDTQAFPEYLITCQKSNF